MAIQIFGTNKNFDCKKAQMWFKERRIQFQFIDLKEKEINRYTYMYYIYNSYEFVFTLGNEI